MNNITVTMLAFLLTGCMASARFAAEDHTHDPRFLVNRTWQWRETVTPTETMTVDRPERYTLRFDDDRVRVRFDCNQGGGSYRLRGETLRFGPLMSTRMACPQGSLESVYMRQLQGVGSFFIREDDLYLELRLETGTMRFMAAPGD